MGADQHQFERNAQTGNKILKELIVLYALCGCMAVCAGFFYFIFGMELTPLQIYLLAVVVLPFVLAAIVVVDVIFIIHHWRPIQRFFYRTPDELTPMDAEEALSRAINFPLLTFIRTVLIHLPTALLMLSIMVIIVQVYFNFNIYLWQFSVGLLIGLIIGLIHGVIEAFYVERLFSKYISTIQQYVSSPEKISRRIHEIKMRRMLLTIFGYTILIPVLVLAVTLLIKADSLFAFFHIDSDRHYVLHLSLWLTLLVLTALFVMFAIGYILSGELNRPLESILNEIPNVEKGVYRPLHRDTMILEYDHLLQGFNHMLRGLQERDFMKNKFGSYVPGKNIMEKILSQTSDLSGEERDISILFCDIRDFSTLSQKMTPQQTVELLNDFFSDMVDIVHKNEGIVDKFIGDAIMVLFGVAGDGKDHAQNAAKTALEMKQKVKGFQIGIGINSGSAVLGNIGSENRLEYTAIGDSVNIASRLEELTKTLNCSILISDSTQTRLSSAYKVADRGLIALKGKKQEIRFYELVA